MTEQPGDSSDPKSTPNDLTGVNQNGSGATDPSLDPSSIVSTEPQADDGLPEWEPLTPELVEDEAIRGDFVIRWVVVGLALLLGISQISETRTLIHLKSGLQLIQNGFLPRANDQFSYTASDRKWVNLPWLFDITTAAIYSVGGSIALSIFQGILACVAFGFLAHTVRPNIRTWWGSICAALALLACYAQITIQPELITLLGMSLLLWTIVRSEEPGQSVRLWSLVPIIWLWAQFDQRAWFGWFLLFLWAAGERLSRDSWSASYSRLMGTVAFAAFAIVALHPFLWESWLAPFRMYLVDYPAMRFAYQRPTTIDQVFFPLWSKFLWSSLSHRTVAALVLEVATLATLVLNRSRIRYSHLFAFVGFNLMGLYATHELAAASLVNCVIATLNAQTWYRDKFGQVYSIDWRELLFSRGGRAVTVLSFFCLAWLVLSGRLDGPGGKRTGVGFDLHLANAMNDYQKLNTDLLDDHPFNFSVRQGDLMIWGGEKTFVDSRVGLFYGAGDKNLLALHNKTRVALQQKREGIAGTGEPTVWKAVFDQYQIHQAWPRLNGPIPPPDYVTFADLLASGNFAISRLNSSTAVFIRIDQADEATTAYVKDHTFDAFQTAFRTESTFNDQTREWSKPATQYDNLFSLRRPTVPGGIQAAKHFLQLAAWGGEMSNSQRIAFALNAIRNANEGLREDPNCVEGYRVLGLIYSILGQLESGIIRQGGMSVQNSMRYFQSVSALQQALALQPDDMVTMWQLIQQYDQRHRMDIQLELALKLKRMLPYSRSMSEEHRQERDRVIDLIGRLEDPVSQIDAMVAKHLDEGADRFQVAVGAYQAGGILRAIKTLEEDAIYLSNKHQARLVLGNWLMEVGRGREAIEIFESLEALLGEGPLAALRDPSAIAALSIANYQRSIKLWNNQIHAAVDQSLVPVMFSLPFLALDPYWMGQNSVALFPQTLLFATAQFIQEVQVESLSMYYQLALTQIESGAKQEASLTIKRALQINPSTPLRPVFRFYLECLTGELVDLKYEAPQSEEFSDLLAVDETPDAARDATPAAKQQ